MTIVRFFAMIGALLRDPQSNRYLILQRAAEKDIGAGEWECVTGRVDQGEGFPKALQREVMEELGVEVIPEFIIGTSHFYRGPAIPENEMVGVLYACRLDDPDSIQTSWEHAQSRWVTAVEAADILPADHWLSDLIQRAEALRTRMPEELLGYIQEQRIF